MWYDLCMGINMKWLLSLAILISLIWIVELRDGRTYRGKEISAGRGWVTITQCDGERITFSWWDIKSITNKEE